MENPELLIEEVRLTALRKLHLLDTAPSEAFDRITRLAAMLFDLPISAVSLTDSNRQWFKSRVGIDHTSIPRERAPCSEVAGTSDLLVIPDLLADTCYRDSHLSASGIRFYAGAPLNTAEGHCLGAMCVLGFEPRQITVRESESLRDMAAMVMSQIELMHMLGRIDPISRLPNRTQFIDDIRDLRQDAKPLVRYALTLVNLASPEQISTLVRVMGATYLDTVIAEAGEAISHAIGPARKVYHVAGTQFAFFGPQEEHEDNSGTALVALLDARRDVAVSRFVTNTTVGIAPFLPANADCHDLLRMAHCAAQDALEANRPISTYSVAEDIAYRRRFTLLNEFAAALGKPGELRLMYQPRIDLETGVCVGVEALLRWTHPTLGEVSPGEFIPIVEHTTIVQPMTAWVMRTALKQLSAWSNEGMELQMSVNIATANLLEPDFIERLQAQLKQFGLVPGRLEIEVTEGAVMSNPEMAQATLEIIADAGFSIAIDDFGTGHSSLAYLQNLPAQVVKIDQSFMRDLDNDERKQALVSKIISLSHELGYRVVAEGIETPQMLAFIREAGCDEGQGYLFARPMTAPDFVRWWEKTGVNAIGLSAYGHTATPVILQ